MIALTVVFRHSAHQIALRAGHHGAMHGVILPQSPVAPFGLTVRDLVAQGRYPYQNWLQQWSAKDEKIVQQALLITDLLELADRALDTLSGEPHRDRLGRFGYDLLVVIFAFRRSKNQYQRPDNRNGLTRQLIYF